MEATLSSLETKLTAVTVYPDRARLVRRGNTRLEPGNHKLEIAGLPLAMNLDSVRASARGTARARLLGLQVERVFYSEAPLESVRDLESQIEALQDEIASLDAQAERARNSRNHLDELAGQARVYARKLTAGKATLEAQLNLYEGLRGQAEKLDSEILQIQAHKRQVERTVAQLQNQLSQMRSAQPRERYTAFVELEILQAGDLSVELSYVVANAGWKPLYDLRLQEGDGQSVLEAGYLAQVTQQTGEDWQDVDLTLSTARPALASTLPELQPWYIHPVPLAMPLPTPRAAVQAMAMKAMPAGEMARGYEEAVADVAVASVEASGASITYHIPGATSVPADGAPHKVMVALFNLSPKLDYVAAPRRVEAAYRRAKVTNDSPYTLLPGVANLFASDEFIGTTRLELTAPKGEIELYLGVDDRLKIKRELKRREVDKSLVGGKRRIHYGYEILLENLNLYEVTLTLRDQMPASRHEEIKVRLDSAEPKPSEHSELNLLTWELGLASQEKRSLRFDFTVEFPQAIEVQGLP